MRHTDICYIPCNANLSSPYIPCIFDSARCTLFVSLLYDKTSNKAHVHQFHQLIKLAAWHQICIIHTLNPCSLWTVEVVIHLMRRSNSIGQVSNFISCYFSAIQNIIRIFDLLSNKVLKARIWNFTSSSNLLSEVRWNPYPYALRVFQTASDLPLLLYDPQASPVTSIPKWWS